MMTFLAFAVGVFSGMGAMMAGRSAVVDRRDDPEPVERSPDPVGPGLAADVGALFDRLGDAMGECDRLGLVWAHRRESDVFRSTKNLIRLGRGILRAEMYRTGPTGSRREIIVIAGGRR